MASKALASLDEWLVSAEILLAEQAEHLKRQDHLRPERTPVQLTLFDGDQ